jgi:KDO2-lipid IV(A) lauroyltransferase
MNVKQPMSSAAPVISRGQQVANDAKRGRTRTRLWQQIVLTFLVGAAGAVQALSRPAALRAGRLLGDLGYGLARQKRRRAEANLRLAYGDALDQSQRNTLVRGVFRHFGRSVLEFMRGPRLARDDVDRLVCSDGWEHVAAAQAAGNGVLLVTGHLGNWEILGRWLSRVKGLTLTVVAREPESPAMARYLRAMREGAGFTVLSKGRAARDLLRILRRGEAICLLADQSSSDVFVSFFGIPTGTVAGPASLALHTKAPLIPIYCVQLPDGSYRVVCLPPLAVRRTEDHDTDVARITAAINEALEAAVRAYPDQWLWLHNRWKSSFDEKNRERAWEEGEAYRSALHRWRA